MTAGETAQIEANMNVVHNILNGGTEELVAPSNTVEFQMAA